MPRRGDINNRRKLAPPMAPAIMKMLETKTLAQIGKVYGCTAACVYSFLKGHGYDAKAVTRTRCLRKKPRHKRSRPKKVTMPAVISVRFPDFSGDNLAVRD